MHPVTKIETMDVSSEISEEIQEKSPQMNNQSSIVRVPVKHANLGIRSHAMDMSTMVELTSFSTMGKIQPFLVTITSTAALIVDLHCHLLDKEVCGYLGGHWDINSHTLSITNAFPCRYAGKDKTSASMVEAEIAKTMEWQRVTLVGWYHSHPRSHAAPSLRDVDYQLDYQIKMKGPSDNGYTPCVGLICSPYHTDGNCYESNFNVFWSMPPPENRPHEYPRPMLLSYTLSQEPFLPQDALDEIKKCIEYYRAEGGIDFKTIFNGTTTYMERLKNSLASKLPGRNRVNGTGYWDIIREMIVPGSKDESSSSSSSYSQIGLSESLAQTPGVSTNNVFLAPVNFKPDTTITSSITKHFSNHQPSTSSRDKKDYDDQIMMKDTRNIKIDRNDGIPSFRTGELTVSLKNTKNDYEQNKIDLSKMSGPLSVEALDKLGATLSQFPLDLPQHLSQFSDINKLAHFSPSDIVKFPGFSFDELSKVSSNAYARNIANLLGPFSKNMSHIPTTTISKELMSDRKNDYLQNEISKSYSSLLSSTSSSLLSSTTTITPSSMDNQRFDDNLLKERKKTDYSCEQISKSSNRPTDFTTAEELSISSVRPDFGAMLDMSRKQQASIQSSLDHDQGESLNLTKDRQ